MLYLELDGQGARHAQLTRALKQAVLTGRLRPGHRLPSSRMLAQELGLARNTVLSSYEELAAEGFLEGKVGSGSYVAQIDGVQMAAKEALPVPVRLSAQARLAEIACKRPLLGGLNRDLPYNLQYGVPLTNPALTTAWRRELARAASYAPLDYPPVQGHIDLRTAICDYLGRRRGVQVHPDDVLIVSGVQQALSLCAQVLLDPGDGVMLEEPHYPSPWQIFTAHGARVQSIPVDDEGMDCSQLPTLRPPRLIYVTPSHQFPTGAVMSLSRRLALLAYAQQHEGWIFEDDYDGEFRYRGAPLAALRALDTHDRTLYVGTFSKALFPSLRLGYMVMPRALRKPFLRAKLLATHGSPTIEQQALAHFMHSRGFDRHLRAASRTLRARRAALFNGLRRHAGEMVDVQDSQAGMHVLAWLRNFDTERLGQLVELGRERGLGLHPIAPCYSHSPAPAGLLLGYAGLAPAEIDVAMSRFGEVLRAVTNSRTAVAIT